MKFPKHPQAGRAGVALILVLILVGVSILILAGVMQRTQSVAILNERNNNYVVSCNAAEAAVEKVYARMAYDFQSYGPLRVSNNLSTIYQTSIPTVAENSFWSDFQFSDAQGSVGKTYVSYAYSYSGPLPSSYSNLFTISAPVYRIVSNVVNTKGRYAVVGTAQEDVLLAMVPLVTWAIFYNGLLEFSQTAAMTVNGRVQANGPIYVGTSATLVFNSGVSTTANLTAPANNGQSSYGTDPSKWGTTFNATPGYTTNAASVTVSLNMTNSHFLIDIPPSGENSMSSTGQQRLYNQAQMILIVTNAPNGSGNPTVFLTMQSSFNGAVPGSDPSPTTLYYTNASDSFLSTNLPFLSLTNRFLDQREGKTNLVTQIDEGRFSTWVSTNSNVQGKLPASSGIYPTILYVADRRNVTAKQLPVVRLSNGQQLPSNGGSGFTVATQNPLYTLGNYNTQTASSSANQSANTTNTAYTVPAALMADSLTILSKNWTDAHSYTTYAQGGSVSDTTINAAIVVGTMPSTGTSVSTFSGGVQNLPRFLEDWSNNQLWLNTSIIRLWNSKLATNQFRDPLGFNPSPVKPYYNPPTRHFSFDVNFLNSAKVPPGIPVAFVPIRFAWGVPPPSTTTYTPAHN